jgi:polysaccharide biosynthesis protein PslG
MRPLRAVILGALCALCLPLSQAAASPLFGFDDNAVQWGQVSASDYARYATQAGATTARITVDWFYVQPTPDHWIWDQYDAIYNADVAAGIKPIFELAYAPPWARDSGITCSDECRYPPSDDHLADWGRFAARVATRYPQLAAIEVWNEPNIERYWQSGVDAARYVSVVKSAHDAIQATGSTIPVLAGALANGPLYDRDGGSSTLTFRTFLGQMYGNGFAGNAEGISVHDYPSDIDQWRFYETLIEIRDVRDYHNDSLPLWITEIGVSTRGSEADSLGDYGQAVLMPRLWRTLSGMSDVRGVVVHSLVDSNQYDTSSAQSGWGLLTTSLGPKPSYCAFATTNQTGYTCPLLVKMKMPADNVDQNRRWDAQDLVQRAAQAAQQYHEQTGTYVGLDSVALHAIDPSISAIPARQKDPTGATADPSRIMVSTGTQGSAEVVLVCNASQSNLAYCIRHPDGYRFRYGNATGSIGSAVIATNQGTSNQW